MSWMQTYTGKQFWLTSPRPEDVVLLDIAHSLAHQCRYNGHTEGFYSVAQHCVLVSRVVEHHNAAAGLLHDASEAYVTDVPRPLKRMLEGYSDIEACVQAAIAAHFGVPLVPLPDEVHEADNRILLDERANLMAPPPAEWDLPYERLGIRIIPWSPDLAKHQYLERAWELGLR